MLNDPQHNENTLILFAQSNISPRDTLVKLVKLMLCINLTKISRVSRGNFSKSEKF